MRISYQKFWLILWCWTTQIPVRQAAVLSHTSRKGIYHWYELLRSNLPDDPVLLEQILQLDEAYFKNNALVMAKQKGTRKLAFEVIRGSRKSVQREHAVSFLQQYVKPRSKLHTDGAAIYKTIDQWWPVKHRVDIHAKWEFELTSEIEGAFGNFRTFVRRMYHHVTPGKLPELAREFCFRFSSPEIFDSPLKYLQKTLILVPSR